MALTPANLATLQAGEQPMPRRIAASPPSDAAASPPIPGGIARGRLVNIVV